MVALILQGASHGTQTLAGSAAFDTLVGAKQALVQIHSPLQNGTFVNFPIGTADALWKQGQLYLHTTATWDLKTHTVWPTADLLAGKYDAFLIAQAKALAAWKHPCFIRLDGEMNGSWEAWYFADPTEFVCRWRYIVAIFRANGATNVTWVWAPNQVDPVGASTSTAADKLAPYYPGDDAVDWTGFDAYNWGDARGAKSWVPWAGVITGAGFSWIGNTYATISAIAPSKPMLVGEFGCNDTPGDKVAWITDALKTMPNYPLIRAVSYFDWDQSASWTLKPTGSAQAWGTGIQTGPYVRVGEFTMPSDLQPIQPFTRTIQAGDPLSTIASLQWQVGTLTTRVQADTQALAAEQAAHQSDVSNLQAQLAQAQQQLSDAQSSDQGQIAALQQQVQDLTARAETAESLIAEVRTNLQALVRFGQIMP